MPIPCPFSFEQPSYVQATVAYQHMIQALEAKDRIGSLAYTFYLGSVLVSMEGALPYDLRQLISRYYQVAATRLYCLFECDGVEQLHRSVYTILSLVRHLTRAQFESLLLAA
ncbi:9161_t:CDS:1 [Dentiscutata erythropus]|uniref:9161_t:CDS:1 n=1 Tax=Dentiscutata erythropus TaxID=1348616 RepID=A0A9N9GT89_9GLOM|nr:9161_t:CDS:1 [Dentiscutata erythropus]